MNRRSFNTFIAKALENGKLITMGERNIGKLILLPAPETDGRPPVRIIKKDCFRSPFLLPEEFLKNRPNRFQFFFRRKAFRVKGHSRNGFERIDVLFGNGKPDFIGNFGSVPVSHKTAVHQPLA